MIWRKRKNICGIKILNNPNLLANAPCSNSSSSLNLPKRIDLADRLLKLGSWLCARERETLLRKAMELLEPKFSPHLFQCKCHEFMRNKETRLSRLDAILMDMGKRTAVELANLLKEMEQWRIDTQNCLYFCPALHITMFLPDDDRLSKKGDDNILVDTELPWKALFSNLNFGAENTSSNNGANGAIFDYVLANAIPAVNIERLLRVSETWINLEARICAGIKLAQGSGLMGAPEIETLWENFYGNLPHIVAALPGQQQCVEKSGQNAILQNFETVLDELAQDISQNNRFDLQKYLQLCENLNDFHFEFADTSARSIQEKSEKATGVKFIFALDKIARILEKMLGSLVEKDEKRMKKRMAREDDFLSDFNPVDAKLTYWRKEPDFSYNVAIPYSEDKAVFTEPWNDGSNWRECDYPPGPKKLCYLSHTLFYHSGLALDEMMTLDFITLEARFERQLFACIDPDSQVLLSPMPAR